MDAQSRTDDTDEVSEKVEDSFELIAKAVGEAAEKDFIARKRQYLSFKRKKEKLETQVEEIVERIKNNMLEDADVDSKVERSESPDEHSLPTDNKALEEKLINVEEELKKIDVEIEKLYTSPPVDGEMIQKRTSLKESSQLGDILEEVELEEIHTPRLVISLDPHPTEGERLI